MLTEKIAQLNSAIDGVSAQLRPDEDSNEIAVNSEEIESKFSNHMNYDHLNKSCAYKIIISFNIYYLCIIIWS